jgi:hypothetical protein
MGRRYKLIKSGYEISSGRFRVYLNVAFKRQVSVLPKLYNCGSFIDFMGDIRFHLR